MNNGVEGDRTQSREIRIIERRTGDLNNRAEGRNIHT